MRATIFFLTFAVFIATVVWRVDQLMFGDKLAWGEAQARAQMSAMVHALDAEVNSLRDILLLGYSEIELNKKDFSANRPYSRFQMVAKVLPPNLKDDKKDWRLVSTFFQEKSTAKTWATTYVSLALKSIKENDVKMGSANMYALMDPSRKPYLLVLVRGGVNWYAGLLGPEIFQGLMDQQKGQKSTVFVVNLQGQTLGHTVQEYVGSLLTEDPLVSELIKSSVPSGFGTFKDLKGNSIQGLYEQVEKTNFFAVITTPIQHLTANRNEVRWQLALMGIGLGLIGLALFFFSEKNENRKAAAPVSMPMAAPTSLAPQTSFSTPPSMNNVKMSAYTQVASSLSHELKTPLTSILGHSQMAMGQVDGAAKEHIQKIEHEARAARNIVQKLLIFAGEDKVTTQKMGLETVLNKALKMVEGKIISKGIKLTKHIESVPQFTMATDLLVKATENILINAIEAMERAPRKELNVKLRAEGAKIFLTIADTGEGIGANDLGKIFDPFFTTRTGTQHVGLGLSTAMGIFKEAFGEIQVQSEKGKGTTVTVEFNPQESLLSSATPVSDSQLPKAKSQPSSIAAQPAPVAKQVPVSEASTVREETIEMDPLLVDNTIERLIEDDLPEMPPAPTDALLGKIMPSGKPQNVPQGLEESEHLPPPPVSAQSEKPAPQFSSKIDKPKIQPKKKTSRLDEIQVAVRRPGERL